MEEAERAAAGKLLQPCSAKTRKRGADDDQSDPHRRVYRSDHAVPVPRLRAGERGVEARVHDRARGPAARAHDAGARSRAAAPGDRRRPAMVRPEGHYPSAELLRGGPRRVLAAPVRDVPRDRERGRGLVEHRSESTAPAREVGCPGCPQAARDAAALLRGRARRVERRARAHGRGGGSAPAASRAPDLEAGTHAVANRITGLLATQGIGLPPGTDIGAAAKTVRLWDGSPVPAALRTRLEREWEPAQFLRTRILALERERQRAIAHGRGETIDKVRQLLRLRAVGPTGAWVYVNEFFGWRRFRNRKEVGAAAGLTPTPYQSGDERREQGISKAGSRHIRAVAIEMAWGWLRYQPRSRLSQWYQARFGRGGTRARKVGIVALARKLLIALWRFLEFGVVPEGARLKTA